MTHAATYIRTDPEGELPTAEEQRRLVDSYAAERGYEIVARYEDAEAPGKLLYHKPGLKQAIDNIKEAEDWETLIVAEPRCVSDDDSALHELVHKFSLYGNTLESPTRGWEDFLAAMQKYRRAQSQRR
jgi:DNA invertase Pin-like site-specific DNA recombinase